ncbi:MAG TPA: hypothetical protein VNL71_23965, partial [Chloroflexota bacterium]|nr:hypothetical protein [Chloroflexota bacterium]
YTDRRDPNMPVLAWHFPHAGDRGEDSPGIAGQTLATTGSAIAGVCGLQGATSLPWAIHWSHGPIVERVALWGERDRIYTQMSAQFRHCFWALDLSETLQAVALGFARRIVRAETEAGRPLAPCIGHAIHTKAGYLRGKVSRDALIEALVPVYHEQHDHRQPDNRHTVGTGAAINIVLWACAPEAPRQPRDVAERIGREHLPCSTAQDVAAIGRRGLARTIDAAIRRHGLPRNPSTDGLR